MKILAPIMQWEKQPTFLTLSCFILEGANREFIFERSINSWMKHWMSRFSSSRQKMYSTRHVILRVLSYFPLAEWICEAMNINFSLACTASFGHVVLKNDNIPLLKVHESFVKVFRLQKIFEWFKWFILNFPSLIFVRCFDISQFSSMNFTKLTMF